MLPITEVVLWRLPVQTQCTVSPSEMVTEGGLNWFWAVALTVTVVSSARCSSISIPRLNAGRDLGLLCPNIEREALRRRSMRVPQATCDMTPTS
jgi:hypothetical protein